MSRPSPNEAAGPAAERVAVVMLTLNQRETTLRCLESFRQPQGVDFDLLVWDNGSSDGTVQAVQERFPEFSAHHHEVNLGVACGRNAGAALAIERFDPSHLLFMDNDMEVSPGFIGALLEPFRADPYLGQTQAKLRFMHDRQRLNDGGGCRIRFWLGETRPVGFMEIDRGQYDEPRPCIACGGAMLVRRDVFEQLGGFDACFNPFGPEDIDFSLRLQKAGYGALYVPRALAYHEVSHSYGAGYTETYARGKVQHWVRLLRRHASPAQKLAFFCIGAPFIVLRMVVREGRRGNFGALRGAVRGAIDLLKTSPRPGP